MAGAPCPLTSLGHPPATPIGPQSSGDISAPAAPAAVREGQQGSYDSEPAASVAAGQGQLGSYVSKPAIAAIEAPGATYDAASSLASSPPPPPPPPATFAAATLLPEAPSTNLLLAGSDASLHPPPPPPSAAAAVPAALPEAPSIDLLLGSDCTCLLLHIHHSGIPPVLKKLLESGSVRKAGLNITGDAHKLRTDFGLELGGLVELGSLANERCMVQVEGISLVLAGERQTPDYL